MLVIGCQGLFLCVMIKHCRQNHQPDLLMHLQRVDANVQSSKASSTQKGLRPRLYEVVVQLRLPASRQGHSDPHLTSWHYDNDPFIVAY